MQHPLILSALFAFGLLAAPHEDDPKMLFRRPAVAGTGFASNPSTPFLGAGGGSPFASSGITLLSWMTLGDLDGAASGNDCWGYTSGSGREYALVGTSSSTLFVEITDPGNPLIVHTEPGPGSLWRDVKTYQDHAYSVSEGGGGIQVFDLSQIDAGIVTYHGEFADGGSTSSHNVVIDEHSGFLYRLGGGSNHGLRVYDLTNPSSPVFVSSWLDRYIHDAQALTLDIGTPQERELIYACSGEGNGGTNTGFEIIDVTDKQNIVVLDRFFYTASAYSHQGWLSADGQIFYLGDELDEGSIVATTETKMLDVSNPSNISQIGVFTNGNPAIGHNMYTRGDLLFQANYTSGLRVFDTSIPSAPVETAWFDTSPSGDAASFNGLWNVYPYFPSGIVIGSDLERGLFVMWVGSPLVEISGSTPSLISPGGDDLVVTIDELAPGDLDPSSPELVYDAGAGTQIVPLVSLGADQWRGTFPALACGTNVSFYLRARSNNGMTWNYPSEAPSGPFVAQVAAGVIPILSEDFEAGSAGWQGGQVGDTATTGTWVLDDPFGTAAQPEDDHSVFGNKCWVTGNSGVGLGDDDVDGGFTTLVTSDFNLSATVEPQVSYWRWYSNSEGGSPFADQLVIDISDDGGSNWTNLEVVGPTGPGVSGGWIKASFRVLDFVNLTSQVRLRFIAEDSGSGSIVEAAIDDLEIGEVDCSGTGAFNYCSATANTTGLPARIAYSGSLSITANDSSLLVSQLPFNTGIFATSLDPIEMPLGNGTLCLGNQTLGFVVRIFPTYVADMGGNASVGLDLANPAFPEVAVNPGDTWYYQAWFRDSIGSGFNFSDAVSVTYGL